MNKWINATQLTLGCYGQHWVISLHSFYVHLACVSFCICFGPILTVPVPPDRFLVAFPKASVSHRIWLSPGASIICRHTLSAPLDHIFLPLWGRPKVYRGCAAIGSCQNQNSLIKKRIMLQSTLHYSFKVLCEHYLINHHNSSGEDKHCWLSYLDHILKELFFLVIVWLCYEMWMVIFILAIWI